MTDKHRVGEHLVPKERTPGEGLDVISILSMLVELGHSCPRNQNVYINKKHMFSTYDSKQERRTGNI